MGFVWRCLRKCGIRTSVSHKVLFFFFCAALLFLLFHLISFYFFSGTVQNTFLKLYKNYYKAIEPLAEQSLENRELQVVSNLMDEKTDRINRVVDDIEKMTALVSFNVRKYLRNSSVSDKTLFYSADFKEQKILKQTLQKSYKYDVPVSFEFPDALIKDGNLTKRYNYLYWEMKDVFSQLYELYPYVLWTYIGFENDGSFINFPGTYSEPDDYDPRKRPWYMAAKAKRDTAWVEPYFDSGQGSVVITVSKPIYYPNTKNLFAVVGTDILVRNFVEDIAKLNSAYAIDFIVTTSNADVIYEKSENNAIGHWEDQIKKGSITKYLGALDLVSFANLQTEGFNTIGEGKNQISVYKRKLKGVDWYLVGILRNVDLAGIYSGVMGKIRAHVDNSEDQIRASIGKHYYGFIAQFALIVALVGLVYYLLKQTLVEPIRVIDKWIGSFFGDMTTEITGEVLNRDDELGHVARSFSELQKRINEYQNELAKNARLAAIGTSTSMIAHDVRKPLAAMKMMLNQLPVIKDDPLTFEKIRAEADLTISRTNAMLNEMMDFSKDSTALELQECNPKAVIASAVSEALRNYPAADIEIEYNLGYKHTMKADVIRVTRTLTNIIDNALDAMTNNDNGKLKGKLRIASKDRRVDDKKFVIIKIEDSGPGISDDLISKIFDPFFTFGKKKGTGLGLAICQKIINMHGGNIMVQKGMLYGGAEFIIELPMGEGEILGPDSDDDDLIHHSKELDVFRREETLREVSCDTENAAEFMRINKRRGHVSTLLIVDDEPLFRETLRSLFLTLGQVKDHVKIIEADSGEKALGLLDERVFDYVIADIDLGRGRMNGYTLSQTVLEKYPDTHVLIHSNKRKEEMDKKIRNRANGRFMGFLPKPMKASELLQFLACKSFETCKQGAGETPVVPVTLGKDLPDAVASGRSQPATAGMTVGNDMRKKVILLNDDEAFLMGLKMDLKEKGYQVLDAMSVNSALDHFVSHGDIHAIVSDINLGECAPDGFDFLKQVREKDQKIPFIFTSGYSRDEVWSKAKTMGATNFLQLPFEIEELAGMIG